MDWMNGFKSSSLMILWSHYCAAYLRGTVTCDRAIGLRLGLKRCLKRRGMKGSARSATNHSAVPHRRLGLSGLGRRLGLKTWRQLPDDKFLQDPGERSFTNPDQRVLQDQLRGTAIVRRICRKVRCSSAERAPVFIFFAWPPGRL